MCRLNIQVGSPMQPHHPRPSRPLRVSSHRSRRRVLRRVVFRSLSAACGLALLWMAASIAELATGQRILPWNAYGSCGNARPALPSTVRVGLYEEFPNPWRLERLRLIDFPVTLAIAAPSHEAFLKLRT